MSWNKIKIIILGFDTISVISNVILLILFRNLWKDLRNRAWLLIMGAFFFALLNNGLLMYLFLFRVGQPSSLVAEVIIFIFSLDQAIKNVMWLTGFILLDRYFGELENLPDRSWRKAK